MDDDHKVPISLYPKSMRASVDRTLDTIYTPINNGVYRAGFATEQAAYEEVVNELFAALDHWERVLEGQRFLRGAVVTEADTAMFTTLLRFDPVYFGHFKCNVRRISDYPQRSNYLRDMFQLPGVAALTTTAATHRSIRHAPCRWAPRSTCKHRTTAAAMAGSCSPRPSDAATDL